jgi:hypothetical protein
VLDSIKENSSFYRPELSDLLGDPLYPALFAEETEVERWEREGEVLKMI